MWVWTGGQRWRRLKLLRLPLPRWVLWCVVLALWFQLVLVSLTPCVSGLMIAWTAWLK